MQIFLARYQRNAGKREALKKKSHFSAEPPILLPMAAYHGTLAAVRCLGAVGIRVTLAESDLLVPAVWSRFVWRRVSSPRPEDPQRFIGWLLDFGAREPGYVLYPTSDDVAFLYARYREELARFFVLRHSNIDSIYALLNKTRLRVLAEAVGLSMPRTWVPHDESVFAQVEAEAHFPVVIKPQTQALLHPHVKGVVAGKPADLRRTYAEFAATTAYAPIVLAHDPAVSIAAVQEYVPAGSEDVYGISGFIDESGELFAARASRKVLQQPRRLGVGLSFEEADLLPELVEKVFALCRRAGYHGVFEAEFIASDGVYLLIDFNPRFYGQMAFDIARGLPQPLLAYDHALGRCERLKERIHAARASAAPQGLVYCRGFEFKLLLLLRRLWRTMPPEEADRWWTWLRTHQTSLVDAVSDAGDRLPGWFEVLHHIAGFLRHPRSFIRNLIWW